MTDKQNFEIKETFTYGHELLTGKQTKYEFVKQDFEKDIDVPSKQKIMYDYNAKDCEQCSSDSVCCYCKNLSHYKLEEKLKAKEQECEQLRGELYITEESLKDYKAHYDRQCEQLDQFKKANDEKNELLAKLGCPTVATARMKAFTLEQQLEAYKMEAEEGKEINAELKAENEKIEQCIIEQNRLVVGMTKEIETLTFKKYELLQTLAEIKEFIEQGVKIHDDIIVSKQILQKISEVEND